MNKCLLLFPVILSCSIILFSTSFPIDVVFSSHDTEEITIYELGEDFVSEESICTHWFFIGLSASEKQPPICCSGKVKLQFKDVETPPPESLFC